ELHPPQRPRRNRLSEHVALPVELLKRPLQRRDKAAIVVQDSEPQRVGQRQSRQLGKRVKRRGYRVESARDRQFCYLFFGLTACTGGLVEGAAEVLGVGDRLRAGKAALGAIAVDGYVLKRLRLGDSRL